MAISDLWPPPLGPRLWDEPPYVRYPDSMPFPPIGRLRCLPKGPNLIPADPVERDRTGAVVLRADQVCACGHTWGEHRHSSIYDDHPFCHACAIEDRLRVSGGES